MNTKKSRFRPGAVVKAALWGFNVFARVLVIVIIAYPFAWMILTAFKPYEETVVYPPTFFPKSWVLDGLISTFKLISVGLFLKNSLVISCSILVFQFLIIIPAAYAFARCSFYFKNFLFGIVLLGFMIPQQLTFIPVYLLFSRLGILQSYLPLVLPFAANAFGIFLLRQYFMQIPEDIIEAARLDDAGELKIILKIMIPVAKTAIFTIGLLSFISSWNSYFWPLIMTTRETFRPLPIGVAMLTSAENGHAWHIMMAGNLFLVVPILTVYLIANKQIRKAFAYSGIK
ncbi:MAG: carbohydrate ABC transporter permease [Treponema sp.]|jgi:sn-glycerol 3-phosphate transport system permease protein|nr:carbohydrate ABC transporter permease [Treponema sp.]